MRRRAAVALAALAPIVPVTAARGDAQTVFPMPAQARTMPNAPCSFIEHDGQIHVCEFGTAKRRATATVALIGDSHASHWRAAIEVVATARRWRGLSITQTSCPLSKAVRELADRSRFKDCVRWKPQVYRWLARHPEVNTVFVSQLSGGSGVVAGRGAEFATQVDGYRRAWRALPASVTRIIVIRDTPKATPGTAACVERALARRARAGLRCAIARQLALDPDPAAVAARLSRSRRVRVVDLTRRFCGPTACYPVVGGLLVHKDGNHITATFARSLGRSLGRALR